MRAQLPLALIVVLLTSVSPRPRDRQETSPASFAFRPDQSVYIVAFHHEDNHGTRDAGRIGIGEYLSAAQLVRQEFERARVFKPIDKPSDADYVFVVYIHDRSAEALAIAPEKYSQSKGDLLRGDLDLLRDAAYGRYVVGPFKLPTVGRITTRLVRTFHDEAMTSTGRP